MAIGKSKRQGGKGNKKKKVETFAKKEWYRVMAPTYFKNRKVGWTPVNKSQGNFVASENLLHRHFKICLADLKREGNTSEAYARSAEHERSYGFKNIELICEEVDGNLVLTNFHGMSLTTDKERDMIKKYHTRISAYADVRTTDGYLLRIFVAAKTKSADHYQVKTTNYAKTASVKTLRARIVDKIQEEVSKCDLKTFVEHMKSGKIDGSSGAIEKACTFIFPIEGCVIRKVKMLRKPPADYTKIMALHAAAEDEDVVEAALDQAAAEDEEYAP